MQTNVATGSRASILGAAGALPGGSGGEAGALDQARRIAIVGGVERMEPLLRAVAAERGRQLEFHGGHMSGPASGRLKAMVDRVDVVVIVTDVNSHAAVTHARTLARRVGRRVLLVRRLGPSQLREMLA